MRIKDIIHKSTKQYIHIQLTVKNKRYIYESIIKIIQKNQKDTSTRIKLLKLFNTSSDLYFKLGKAESFHFKNKNLFLGKQSFISESFTKC